MELSEEAFGDEPPHHWEGGTNDYMLHRTDVKDLSSSEPQPGSQRQTLEEVQHTQVTRSWNPVWRKEVARSRKERD